MEAITSRSWRPKKRPSANSAVLAENGTFPTLRCLRTSSRSIRAKYDLLTQPPGALIKPKTDKARGRPRLPTNVQLSPRRMPTKTSPSQTTTASKSLRGPSWTKPSAMMSSSSSARAASLARIWPAAFLGLWGPVGKKRRFFIALLITSGFSSRRNTLIPTGKLTNRQTSSTLPTK